MNKNIRAQLACKYLVCALLFAGAAACDKEGFTYDNLTEENGTDYLVTDTFTLNMSTIYIDSIPTSNQGVVLVGTTTDPNFGTISASSYWKVRAFSGTSPAERAIYDSTMLMIHPKTYAYGDTMQPQHMEVYQVTQEIKKPASNTYFYSYYNFATNSTPLGSIEMPRIRPHLDTVYRIRLSDAIGQDFLAKAIRGNVTLTNQEQFSTYFRGLYIKPGANSKVVTALRADDSLNIRVFYHVNDATQVTSYIDFPLFDNASQFNHIDFTRPAGSPLATLTPGSSTPTNKLPAENAGDRTYIQNLTNVVTRIDVPSLPGFGITDKYFKIMHATLTVRPERLTYFYPNFLPPRLTLVALDKYNTVTDSIISPNTGAVQTGSLVTDDVYNLGTAYTYDITNYVIAQINSTTETSRALGLVIPSQTGYQSFSQTILGGPKNHTNKLELKVYYLRYN